MRRVGSWALSLTVHLLLFGLPSPERPPVMPGEEAKKIPVLLLPIEGPAMPASGSPAPPAAGKGAEGGPPPPTPKPAPASEKRASGRPAIPSPPKEAPPPLASEAERSSPLESTVPKLEAPEPPSQNDSGTAPPLSAEGEAPAQGEILSSNRPASEGGERLSSVQGGEESGGGAEALFSTGGRPGGGPSAPGGGAEWERYLASLRARIEAARVYPERARRMGQEGKVTIRLVVGEDGKILEVGIAEPSSFPLLNRAAVQTIRSLSPLPLLPPELGERLEVTVPIAYHLIGLQGGE